jgi:predicted kinase|nr:MAG TPA: polynucleotide kinase [Crassvirales sp.]
MSEVIILQGIQGSGKSTWALDYVTKEPTKRVRINRDSIRKMFGKYWVLEREELCNEIEDKAIAYAMVRGFDIVIDDMNLNPKSLKHIKELILNVDNKANIIYKLFNTPLVECVTRVEKRNASLPEDERISISVVLKTFNKYKEDYNLTVE